MGVLRLAFELIFVTGAVVILIASIPTNVLFEDFPIEPESYEVQDLQAVVNKVGWEPILGTKARLFLKDKVVGPESLVISRGFIYAGLADGRIIEIDKESLNFRLVTRIVDSNECYDFNYWRPNKCGRPLGMRIDPPTGNLIVVDPHFGVYKVWVKSGKTQLLGFGENDKRPKEFQGLLNDLVLDPEDPNIAYVTVSTQRWGLDKIVWELLERKNSGMVVAVDFRTQKLTKIVDNLYAANGIEVNPEKTHLLISECTAHRIVKVNLDQIRKQLKSGKVSVKPEPFAEILPGEPDNIRQHNGELYVGMALARYGGPSLSDRVSNFPIIRKALARTLHLTSKVIKFVRTSLYEHPAFEELEFMLSSGHVLYSAMPNVGAIVILDGKSGKIKRILGSNKFSYISEAVVDETNGDIFFGSFRNRFIGKLSIKDL
ncbi:adipocyte plasma membrane-associated protein-like protein [Leptotrombidium deliense]|uniref:Adipocyte plasma membrane-associated protein-like protein n=1 Tax=Leptotrombidium deliense TaxID=299467 RepID=A0A443SU92_9ACAR|nr:adipocyte plasma membrane-associated protein-like protein [Leptotrombidium deliense]